MIDKPFLKPNKNVINTSQQKKQALSPITAKKLRISSEKKYCV